MTRWRRRLRCSPASICASKATPSRPPAAVAAHSAALRRLQRRDLLRLQPDDDEMAFHFAAGCAEHPARGDRSDGRARRAGLCLHFRRIERQGAGAVRPHHHRALLVSPGVRAERAAFRLSLFPLYARSPPCPDRRGVVDPADRPRRRRRGAAARRSRAAPSSSSGRSACCRRRSRIAASRSATCRCSAGSTTSRTWSAIIAGRGKPISRIVMTPSAFEPEAHPEAVLMRAQAARPVRQPPAVARRAATCRG